MQLWTISRPCLGKTYVAWLIITHINCILVGASKGNLAYSRWEMPKQVVVIMKVLLLCCTPFNGTKIIILLLILVVTAKQGFGIIC